MFVAPAPLPLTSAESGVVLEVAVVAPVEVVELPAGETGAIGGSIGDGSSDAETGVAEFAAAAFAVTVNAALIGAESGSIGSNC